MRQFDSPAVSGSAAHDQLALADGEESDLDKPLASAFERAVERFAARVAVCSGTWSPTYRELNETANRLAHRLFAEGGAAGDRVVILMDHDTPAVAATVGSLKAGRVVAALNPHDPPARLEMLVADVEPSVIVTDGRNRDLAAGIAKAGCRVVDFETAAGDGPTDNPPLAVSGGDTAFLVYTSGTTGRPKGVMKTHRQVRRTVAAHTAAMRYTEADRIPLFAMMSAGQGVNGLWWTLLNGATLCPFAVRTRGVTGLARWINDRGLTVYISSASIFRALMKTIDDRMMFTGVRAVRLASERATADDFRAFRRHFPDHCIFVHTMSCSETSSIAWSRWNHGDTVPEGTLTVGKISVGQDVRLVDERGLAVGRGEVGEIVVRSRCLAAGYWRDPELTAARFTGDLDDEGTREFRTGDLGRWNADGTLEIVGRADERIKIRGNRVELLEIETTLRRLPGIERAAVIAVGRPNFEPLLVGFVVAAVDASWSAQRLRHAVGANLPHHMIPSRFVFLDALPYTASGKIDRGALKEHPLALRDGEGGEAPRSATEIGLAEIWAEVFERPHVGRDDSFFSMGGDSLAAAIVAAEIHAAFGVELSLAVFAEHPTLAALASEVDRRRLAGDTGLPAITLSPRTGAMPLSLFQERIWKLSARPEVQAAYLHTRTFSVSGPLDVDLLMECLGYLIDRHEALRTTFAVEDGRPVQIIHPSSPLDFTLIDLSGAPDAGARAHAVFKAEASKSLDLSRLPILRYVAVKVAENEHLVLRVVHTMMADGSSWAIHATELAALYEARLRDMSPPIPREMPLQYADYAVWQREVLRRDGPAFGDIVGWWKAHLGNAPAGVALPWRRLEPGIGHDPAEGVIRWCLEPRTADRLDRLARERGATHFIVRLAAFVALIADITGMPTVVIGTYFVNRSRLATRNIMGVFTNMAPLVFSFDPSVRFGKWLEAVRNRVFETERVADLPYEQLCEELRSSGVPPPDVRIIFALSSSHARQEFAGLTVSHLPALTESMPWGCTIYIDEHVPTNCAVEFDAGLYERCGMEEMLERYLELLDAAARGPELTVGQLLAMSRPGALQRARRAAGTAISGFRDAAARMARSSRARHLTGGTSGSS